MIIAHVKPEEETVLEFDMNISGTSAQPDDIRFILEAPVDDKSAQYVRDGETARDVFAIICRAIRTDKGVKVIIPRLLNLYRSGTTARGKLEVILENRIFTPLSEEIFIDEPVMVEVQATNMKTMIAEEPKDEEPLIEAPKVTVNLSDTLVALLNAKKESVVEDEHSNEDVSEEVVAEETEEVVEEQPKIKRDPFAKRDIDNSWREQGFESFTKNPFKRNR